MDAILKFIMNNYVIFLILFIVFAIALVGYFADLKMPKKEKRLMTEEEEMEKRLFELKNSPLAQTTLNSQQDNKVLTNTPIVMEEEIKENFK